MRKLAGPGTGWRRPLSVGVVAALAAGLAGVAAFSHGLPIAEVDLNDSGVWTTNESIQYIGRFNFAAQQFDGVSYQTDVTHFDLLQEGATVFVTGTDDGSLIPVNPATLATGRTIPLGTGSQVSLGGGMVGVFVPEQGKFWLMPASAVASFDPATEVFPAAVEGLPANAVTQVGSDGTGYVADPASQTISVVSAGGGGIVAESPSQTLKLPGLAKDGHYSMTVVGTTPVVADLDKGTLYLGNAKTATAQLADGAKADSVVLQDVSGSAPAVVYTTPDAVVAQPLDGSAPAVTPAQTPGGVAEPPVQFAGCTYAVWSRTGSFVRDCPGDSDDLTDNLEGLGTGDRLRFRVNRGHIVLNQIGSGGVWLVSDLILRVDDWDTIIAGDQGNQDEQSTTELDENAKPDRTSENHPPVAVDDKFGARPGQSVLLPVVENDTDEDGDLLTVQLLDQPPKDYELSLVYSDSVVQMNTPTDASGAVSFRYKVSDGRGGEAQARVTVTIRPDSVNSPPEQVRLTNLTVTSGHRVSYNVLANWRDPDGDPIFLVGATGPKEDLVTPVQDGSLTFQDGGKTTGRKTIEITVSDGRATKTGEVVVNVLPTGNRPPEPVPDLVSGMVGAPITIKPLENDYDPDGNTLRLTRVDGDPPQCSLVKELSQGIVTITCLAPGSSYLDYGVTDGPSAAVPGWIRVFVRPPAAADAQPVAVPDTVLLSPGQEVVTNPLDNDVNPLGYPLVITSVYGTDNLPVDVAVIDYSRVRITEKRHFEAPVSFNYQISNGKGYATSRITVVPVPAPERVLSPTAVDDTVTVRAGDIATVRVLDNDTQPSGLALRLRPDLVQSPDPDTEVLAFTSGNTIRVHARATPGTYTVLYQVEVLAGSAEPDTGRLTIYVTAPDDRGANMPPRPREVEARTLVGRPVTVSIPLDGIDPDGDFVSLEGVGSPPTKGMVTSMTPTGFVYDPGDSTDGGDEFTYVVRDRLGLEATGRVVIGIAPASGQNRPPLAVTDVVEARPGRVVTVPVTRNDSDPDGAKCCYLVDGSAASDSFKASTQGQNVVLTTPDAPGSYWATYAITNEFDLESTGVITVRVADDVPLRPPILGDDNVSLLDALGAESVTIPVKNNDWDPDGDVTKAAITVGDPAAQVTGDNVVIPVTPALQIIDYYLTDTDGLKGHGFITVPGVELIPPQFNPSARLLEVKSGESVGFDLADHVLVRPGRTPRVTEAAHVTAWNGSVKADSVTRLTFAAPVGYTGRAAVTVEVTDGASLEDATGLKALVTIPVKVLEADKAPAPPPVLRDAQLDVEAGQSATLNLSPLVSGGAEGATMTFAKAAGPDVTGVEAAVNGTTLEVKAAITVPKATQAKVTVTVDDGVSPPVQGTISVKVVASSKPLPQAVDDRIDNANQGQPVCVTVTANDVNPFPGQPLTVSDARVESGVGQAAIGCAGGQGVTVTPGAKFLGEMVVRYTIRDVTGDPDRESTARIRLIVRGKPDAPAGLFLVQVGNKQVTLSWQPPNNNGAPITGYTVTASPSAPGYPRSCGTATTCTLTDLTNDKDYKFTVTATNEVGTSDPSLESEVARPDAVPYRLDAPSVTFGDKAVTVGWVPKGSPGSSVTSYRLQITPPPPSGQAIVSDVTGVGYVWNDLVNGTEYQIKACAVNKAPGVCEDDSQWSPWSVPVIPAGVPDAPAAPTWTRLAPVGSEGQVEVCWNAPFENGAAITKYTLVSSSGTQYQVTPAGAKTCKATTLPTSTTDYTFTVSATNKAGQGKASAPSAGFRSVVPPGAVTGLTKTDKDNSCDVSFNAAPLNGAKSSEVSYVWKASNGQNGNFGTNTSGTATGLPNNGSYTITVWARTTVQGVGQDGPATDVTGCTPYGKPKTPGVTAGQGSGTQIVLSWSDPGRNGRDYHVEFSLDGGIWIDPGPSQLSGSRTLDSGWSQTHSIKARACDVTGVCSAEASASATAPDQPSCSWSAVNGSTVASVSYYNLPPGSTLLWVWNNGGGACVTNASGCVVLSGSGWEWPINFKSVIYSDSPLSFKFTNSGGATIATCGRQ